MTRFVPETADQVLETVAWAVSEETPLAVTGAGTKSGVGRPINASHELSLAGISGIRLYEPEELVMTVGPGTPLDEIVAALDEHDQELAFEPPDLGHLLAGEAGAGTIGGVVAGNLAGPRRIKAGAARDHFLGFQAVSGRGEAFKSGGRVMKNVTGYDLCKLICGSWGTLAVMTEITLKVLPRAAKERTILVMTDDPVAAASAMTEALNTPYDVSGAGFVPGRLAAQSSVDLVRDAGGGVAAVRVEGPGPSVEYRCARLREALAMHGETEELHTSRSRAFWEDLRDVRAFSADRDGRVVWKISAAPQDGPKLLGALAGLRGADAYLDWGGGLIWLAVDMPNIGGEGLIREALAAHGGHATLMRGSAALRASVPAFQPPDPAVMRLIRRIKEGFDPHGVLNPGRMYEGV